LSQSSESGGSAEPFGVRRQVELPEVNTEAAETLAPTSDTPPKTEAGPVVENAEETQPEQTTEKRVPPVQAQAIVVPAPPGGVQSDGAPPGRPKKPVLAAVAIGGVVVLSIPILLIGTGSHKHEKHRTTAAAATVQPDSEEQPGAFTSASPAVTPTPSATGSPTPKKKPEKKPEKKAKEKDGKHAASKRRTPVEAGPPTGPRFATVTHLLVKNVMTGLCADIPGRGKGDLQTPIQQSGCTGSSGDNQRWDLVVNDKGGGPRGADLFTIRNSKDDYCLDLPGNGAVDHGTHLIEWACSPTKGDNQLWYLAKRSANTFWIRNYTSNKDCLDVMGTDGAGGKGAPLTVWPCDPKDDHLWSFH
jgi:hypothetical protein